MLFGEGELQAIAEHALHSARGDAVEALLVARTGALTRFAANAIHQNVVGRECDLRVRVAVGRRVGVVSTDRLDPEGVARAATEASELARIAPENERFPGIPSALPVPAGPSAFRAGSDAATPLERATLAKVVCDAAAAKGLRASGFVCTDTQEVAVANSNGLWAYAPQTICEADAAVLGDEGSAFAQRVALDVADLDVRALAEEAVAKALAAQRPRDYPVGAHEVVLEPYAVRDLVEFLSWQLTGLAVEEGRSFVGGHMGERVTGAVTLVDDPADPFGMPRAFDFEGQPAGRVVLIEGGVARGVVYDRGTAARAGAAPTGHALPGSAATMALPMSVRLEAGDRTREELIKGVRRGLLVTRFWYTRWVHARRTVVTGMTRDGTFAIEDGEIAYPVRNLRFTQSYHEALGTVRGIGRDLAFLVGDQYGLHASWQRVPALHLGAFNFTGATQY